MAENKKVTKQTNEERQIDVMDVKILYDAVHIAQRRGGFTLQEAGVISKVSDKITPMLEKIFPNPNNKDNKDSKNTKTDNSELLMNNSESVKKDEHSVSIMDHMN